MILLYNDLRRSRHFLPIVLDFLMLFVLLLDLLWLGFDALFSTQYVQDFFIDHLPAFGHYYRDVVHANFLFFDAFVVLIFTVELLVRWAVAIYRKEHYRWFFYPIVHWYDVLGIIPNGSFRILRLFRVFSMIYRLYNAGFLDLRNNVLFKTAIHYYQIAVEEVADRVAIRLLRELQEEIQRGEPLIDQLIAEAFVPRKPQFVQHVATSIQQQLRQQYELHQQPIRDYIQAIVGESVANNKEVVDLERIPLLGAYMRETLRTAVSQIVFSVFDKLLNDFSHSKAEPALLGIVQGVFDVALSEMKVKGDNQSIAAQIVDDCIEIIIARIDIKQWKTQKLE